LAPIEEGEGLTLADTVVDCEPETLCEYDRVGERVALVVGDGETDAERQSVGVAECEEEGDTLTLAESVGDSVPETLREYDRVGERVSDVLTVADGVCEEAGDTLTLTDTVVVGVPVHDPPKHGTGAPPAHDAGKLVSTLSAPSVSTASSTPAAAIVGAAAKDAPAAFVYAHCVVPVAPASA
jgi:hypothetical protein